ncbi:Alkaline phosphatase 4 precursor [Sedimentisphaera cyanobacteriorum]|uniref:Alkaline phosphatase 4 n=1 Tax=Sedimentisphaera cyanobacteriorum TaxID=1940790 RepID=A0A1Q2HSE1_9BACT|nr:alkaline phosphatase [Sedimentisphaera cyanobacteriorum]AQQ10143.1 Alkaline phosphatase 4 precursor [Sedimentisphaera cyanobacteriorum]
MRKTILFAASLLLSVSGFAAEKSCQNSDSEAKYIFYFIGDGMASTQVYAAEAMVENGRIEDSTGSKMKKLAMSNLEAAGSHRNYASDRLITDSAAAGTAMACGEKTSVGTISMDSRRERKLPLITNALREKGLKIGIVSSVSIDHATPACFYANQPSRNSYWHIANQLSESGFEYFAGGGMKGAKVRNGKRVYMPGEKKASPENNPVEKARKAGYSIAHSKAELKAVNPGEKVYAFEPDTLDGSMAMPYEIDRPEGAMSIADYTREGIRLLDNPSGFFLMVEGGKIDWSCHANDGFTALRDVIALDEAVGEAAEFMKAHPEETLIVVTGDHETGGMTMGWAGTGYKTACSRLNSQTASYQKFNKAFLSEHKRKRLEQTGGKWETSLNMNADIKEALKEVFGLAYSDLSDYEKQKLEDAYDATMGKSNLHRQEARLRYGGYKPLTVAVTHMFNQKAGLTWTTFSHTAIPVPIYASGAGAEKFGEYMDNTNLPVKIAEAAGIEDFPAAEKKITKLAK